jgi:ABC-type dipeptide/oligopeptide/nickel transport system permease component
VGPEDRRESRGRPRGWRSRLPLWLVLGILVVGATLTWGTIPPRSGSGEPSRLAIGSGEVEAPGTVPAYAGASPTSYPIEGLVENHAGTPISNATVEGLNPSFPSVTTNASGEFNLSLTRGVYELFVGASGYFFLYANLSVSSPIYGVVYVLATVPTYPLTGQVVDGWSGNGIQGVRLDLSEFAPSFFYHASTQTGPDGSFLLPAPNGTLTVDIVPGSGYTNLSLSVVVTGSPVAGLRISLTPTEGGLSNEDPYSLVLVSIPILLGIVATARWLEERRQRIRLGLPPRVFSPTAQYIAFRGALIPFQLAATLFVLYIFGVYLPAVALARSEGGLCSALNFGCNLQQFFFASSLGPGFVPFLTQLFTLQWGTVHYGALVEPASQVFAWWLPNSIELAVLALGISFLLAYPIGLWAGWKAGGPFDGATRMVSLVGLLLPSLLVTLLVLAVLFVPFTNFVGDTPYGFLPSSIWWEAHNPSGLPTAPWIGIGSNTTPTGFPLIDAALNGAWAAEFVILMKTLLQAVLIAIIYTAIFLRYARHAVVAATRETHVTATRARGVPESTILWHHAGRRVIPIYLLTFAITLPVYLGTQAIVEVLFSDPGVGTLFILEMSQVTQTTTTPSGMIALGGFSTAIIDEVGIFFLVLVILIASIATEVLARHFDHRLVPQER